MTLTPDDMPLLLALSEPHRALLLNANEFPTLSLKDRAVALGLNIGTYKSRYSRAMSALRALRAKTYEVTP